MSLGPGSTVGPFKIESLLGKGGMGEVFSALDVRLERRVALKFLPGDFTGDNERLRRFETEAKTLASLNHPNILSIFEVGRENGIPYLVSELLDGETLREKLNAGAIPQRKALEYGLQIAQGLAAAQAKGIIHRDLKPENIFISKDGRLKILDFGLAKVELISEFRSTPPQMSKDDALTDVESTLPGIVLGTIGYMSPEQVRGQPADHRSDLFSFGVILQEMLTGKNPFRKETGPETLAAILKEEPVEIAGSHPNVPPAIQRLVQGCLEKNPAQRFQSAHDLAFWFECQLGATATSPSHSSRFQNNRTNRTFLPAAVVTLLLVVLIALFWIRRSSPFPANWAGERLSGPALALAPKASSDGRIAVQAMVNGLTQVGVMIPESGAWSVLTTNASQGTLQDLAWSLDKSSIYYDRYTGVPVGVYSVPAVGGEERLELEGAMSPRPLKDGSLLVARLNSERKLQLFQCCWPGMERAPEALPAILSPKVLKPAIEVFPDGEEAVFLGWPADKQHGPEHLYAIHLKTRQTRRLAESLPISLDMFTFPLSVTPDNRHIVFNSPAGNLHRIVAAPRFGKRAHQTLLTLSSHPFAMDFGQDGYLYMNQFDELVEMITIAPSGELKRIPVPSIVRGGRILPLPNNRFLMRTTAVGKEHLMLFDSKGEAERFLKTGPETAWPYATLGRDRILFKLRTGTNETIAVATLDGRNISAIHLPVPTQTISYVAGSPGGETIYFVSEGTVWTAAADGSNPRKLQGGDAVAPDPHGLYVIIQSTQHGDFRPQITLTRFSLSGEAPEAIKIRSEIPLSLRALSSEAVAPDGRIAVGIAPLNSWYWRTAILDPDSGELVPVAPHLDADVMSACWDESGNLVASAGFVHSSIWRFRPQH